MSLVKLLKSMEAQSRRRHRARDRERRGAEREAMKAFRGHQQRMRDQAKRDVLDEAANEVAMFDDYVNLIVSVHKDCGDRWNWETFAGALSPMLPQRSSEIEDAARRALNEYQPGFFDRLLGKAKRQKLALEQRISVAAAEDERLHAEAVENYLAEKDLWEKRRSLGSRIVSGELAAYREAIEHASPYEELDTYDTEVEVVTIESDAAIVNCLITDPDVVPKEEAKLTASGKLSKKAMPAGRYWSLYQDYVCSCAIRVARETLAVVPISRVIVNVGTVRLDSSTGHNGLTTLLTAGFVRETLEGLVLAAIDPSDALRNFPHRMKFKKTSGLEPVEPITLDENWVTTG